MDTDESSPPIPEPTCDKSVTSKKKWLLALVAGAAFYLVSSTYTFDLVNSFVGKYLPMTAAGAGPTVMGNLVMAAIFIVVVRILMW